MLRIRKRRAMSEYNSQKDARSQRSDCDVDVEAVTKTSRSLAQELPRPCTDQTSVNMKVRENSHTDTLSRKKKKRMHVRNLKSDSNPHIISVSNKGKLSKSSNHPVAEPTENVQHADNKKRRGAAVEDSGNKKKKRKFDCDGSRLEADVLRWKSESDSSTEKTVNTTDSVEIHSTSSGCDLQRLEDSIVDDFVSANVIKCMLSKVLLSV